MQFLTVSSKSHWDARLDHKSICYGTRTICDTRVVSLLKWVLPLTQTLISALHALCLRSWPAVGIFSLVFAAHTMIVVSAAFRSAVLLSMAVNVASEKHFHSWRNVTQPCLMKQCIWCNLCDPGILPSSANKCVLGNVYLRSNVTRTHIGSCELWLGVFAVKLAYSIDAQSGKKG